MLDQTPAGAQPTLRDHIKRFELPQSDAGFPSIISALVEEAERRSEAASGTAVINARYFYLLGRAYELLGYSARHTPWLSNSPRFYWQKARDFLDEAKLLVASDAAAENFLYGKLLYREAMIYTLDAKTTEEDLLTQAESKFDAAARIEGDPAMKFIALDAAWIARTERELREFKKELQIVLDRGEKYAGPSLLQSIIERLSRLPDSGSWQFPSTEAGMKWPVQHALAKVRFLYSKAQIYEKAAECVRAMQKQLGETFGDTALKQWESIIKEAYAESAAECESVGLAVRAADSRVTLLKQRAETALRHCIRDFKVARDRDKEHRARLLERAPTRPRVLPADALQALRALSPEQDPVRIPDAVLKAAVTVDLPLDEHATVYAESGKAWIILNGADRYLVQPNEGYLEIVDLGKQAIPFSPHEAATFEKYSRTVHETCELYTMAIREILRLLKTAQSWYDDTTSFLESGTIATTNDVHLGSLYVTVRSTLKEVRARNYPLLSTLRVRTLYAWSLLEMFQMRNQSVRLGTLFSGQCQLIMANPFFEPETDTADDEHLAVGADPIFRTTVDFLFRGAKGEENRHDFQRRALHTTLITIGQQEQSLLIEGRYLNLDPETRRALLARLACHRSLALALEQFTDIFVAQRAGDLPTDEIRTAVREIARHFTDAKGALDASGGYRSKLIDSAGLDGLHDYMRGIALVLIGMNERQKKRDWAASYRNAVTVLESAKKKLIEAGDAYLLPSGTVRGDYLNYVDARILTVSAFQARYHGEQDANPADFAKAADLFARAAGVFENLHDYRVATKARARAADARSLAADTAAAKYRALKEANALYAASADASGYKDTQDRLQNEFAQEEAGISTTAATAATQPSASALGAPIVPNEPAPERFGLFSIKPIASGGMADVFHATGPDGRTFALKRLRTQDLGNQEMRQRLQREFDIASRLKHPSIIDVYSYDDISGVPYLTMELLDGEPLEKAVLAREIFDAKLAAGIVLRIAHALHHAHRHGVIHRDLTPANVMVLKDGGVKVMDFGIARDDRFARMTTAGMFLGTTQYASPEQLQLRPTTPASDLYSLGLIFFELLTGMPGLDRHQRLVQPHPAPSTYINEVPPSLDTIVIRLLEREPTRRYASAEELIGDIETFLRP